MKTIAKRSSNGILVPMLVGAAAAAAVTYLFLTESGSDLRTQYTGKLVEEWDAVKEKYPEQVDKITAVKDKLAEVVTSKLHGGKREAEDVADEASS